MGSASRIKKCLLAAALWLSLPFAAATAKTTNVLVLSSYNPDANNISSAISAMEQVLHDNGQEFNITVESLGYDYISEFSDWTGRMSALLSRYRSHDKRPDIIVTLGQEALSAYLSMNVAETPDVPVICGMCSRNYLELPKDGSVKLSEWVPETHDIMESAALYNIIGGHFYTYDVERNVTLIRQMYPRVQKVAFLSDNSYGGVCMQSLVREYAAHHSEVSFSFLDGRNLNIQTDTDTISRLDERSALLIGTWRFDKDSRYFVTSSLSIIRQSNPILPIFTMSAVGINDCAIGGYTPDYTNVGLRLANTIIEYATDGKVEFDFVRCHYVFNDSVLNLLKIDKESLPKDSAFTNKEQGVVEKYWLEMAFVASLIIILAVCLFISRRNLGKMRKLKAELERKQKELIVAKNRAESNSMLKTSFVANMSHEIRTPLNAVVGFAQVIATQGAALSDEERDRILKIINKNCDLLTGLINQILDISRIESGRAKYEIEKVDIVELSKTVLSSVQMANNTLPIDFRFDCDLDKLMFDTDRQCLQQVLMNLLGNAVKFTQEGNVTLSLQSEADGGICISVTDTGKGIPPDKAEEVFNRFVKLDEYSNGTGLGLSLCQLIVEKFMGRIWVDTAYTTGARFIFTLPPSTKDDLI